MTELTLEQKRAIAKAKAKAKVKQSTVSSPLGEIKVPKKEEPPQEHVPSFTELIAGAGELALTTGTSAIMVPLGGTLALGDLIAAEMTGDPDGIQNAENRLELTKKIYTPKTKTGQKMLEGITPVFETIEGVATDAADKTFEKTGSPGLATSVRAGFEVLPEVILGIKPITPKQIKQMKDAKEVERVANDLNINLEERAGEFSDEVRQAGVDVVGGNQSRGFSMENISNEIAQAKLDAKIHVDGLYTKARSQEAWVESEMLADMPDALSSVLTNRGIKPDNFPTVKTALNDLKELVNSGGELTLNELDSYRKSLVAAQKKNTADETSPIALGIMKGTLDAYTDALFNSAMIKGTPEAIKSWKNARSANADYKRRFKEDKVIRQLAEQNATPETMRKWVFGSSALYKTEAANTVKRIKEIVGEDSPSFNAMRQDAALDLVEPLLKDEPNFKGFTNKYNDFVRKNNSLMKELFNEKQLKELDVLSKLSKNSVALRRQEGAELDLSFIDRAVSVFLFGHGIAKAQLKVKLAEKSVKLLRSLEGQRNRRQAMANILGYDIGKPMFGGGMVGLPSLGEAVTPTEDVNRRLPNLPAL